MAWTKVTSYSLMWNHQQKLGSVNVFLEGSSFQIPLTNLDAKEFAAMSVILRSDPSHNVYYEQSSNSLSSGVDTP